MAETIFNPKVGERVGAATNTLAYYCGDRVGKVEKMDGAIYMLRMEPSGRLVPFRKDQLRPLGFRKLTASG